MANLLIEIDRLKQENEQLKVTNKILKDDMTLWHGTAMTWQRENVMLYNEYHRIEKEKNDYQNALIHTSTSYADRLQKLHEREVNIATLQETNTKLFQDNTKLVGDLMTFKKCAETKSSEQTVYQVAQLQNVNRQLHEDNSKLSSYNEKLKATINCGRTESIFNQLSISHEQAQTQNARLVEELKVLKAELDDAKLQYHHVVSQVRSLEKRGLIRISLESSTTKNGQSIAPTHRHQPRAAPQATSSLVTRHQPAPVRAPQRHSVHSIPHSQDTNHAFSQPLPFQSHAAYQPNPQMTKANTRPSHHPQQILIPAAPMPSQPSSGVSSLSPVSTAPNSSISPLTQSFSFTNISQNSLPSSPSTSVPPPPAQNQIVLPSQSYPSIAQALISPSLTTAARSNGNEPSARAPPTPPRSYKSMSPEEAIVGRLSLKRSPSPRLQEDQCKRKRLSTEGNGSSGETDIRVGMDAQQNQEVPKSNFEETTVIPSTSVDSIVVDSYSPAGGRNDGDSGQEEEKEVVEIQRDSISGELTTVSLSLSSVDPMQIEPSESPQGLGHSGGQGDVEEEAELERDPETGLYREEDVIEHLYEEDEESEDVLYCPFCKNKAAETHQLVKPFVNPTIAELVQHYREQHDFALQEVCRKGLEILGV